MYYWNKNKKRDFFSSIHFTDPLILPDSTDFTRSHWFYQFYWHPSKSSLFLLTLKLFLGYIKNVKTKRTSWRNNWQNNRFSIIRERSGYKNKIKSAWKQNRQNIKWIKSTKNNENGYKRRNKEKKRMARFKIEEIEEIEMESKVLESELKP